MDLFRNSLYIYKNPYQYRINKITFFGKNLLEQ